MTMRSQELINKDEKDLKETIEHIHLKSQARPKIIQESVR